MPFDVIGARNVVNGRVFFSSSNWRIILPHKSMRWIEQQQEPVLVLWKNPSISGLNSTLQWFKDTCLTLSVLNVSIYRSANEIQNNLSDWRVRRWFRFGWHFSLCKAMIALSLDRQLNYALLWQCNRNPSALKTICVEAIIS